MFILGTMPNKTVLYRAIDCFLKLFNHGIILVYRVIWNYTKIIVLRNQV